MIIKFNFIVAKTTVEETKPSEETAGSSTEVKWQYKWKDGSTSLSLVSVVYDIVL